MVEMCIDTIREALSYDAESGILRWRISPSRSVKAGDIAGNIDGHGYIEIRFRGNRMRAHRIAWAMHNGSWPACEIDHKDGCRTNNAAANLRDVTVSVNQQNQRAAQMRNKLGLLGVSAKGGGFRAQIWLDGRLIHIGTFQTPELAHSAYIEAKRRLHEGCTI